ncbi:MAG: hypothetical protein ACREAM_22995, partial [Blastocatellia bacterium]
MIETLDWLRSVSSTARLRGGQPSVCWRRDLSQTMASAAAIRRACDWVGQIAAISPRLRDGSLFGECLAELTRPADASPQPEPETTRPTRKRLMKTEETSRTDLQKPGKDPWPSLPPRSESDCDASAKKRRRSFQKDEGCPAQSVARIQPEADRSLLRRLAGDEVVVDTANQRAGEKLRKGCDTTRPASFDKTKSHRDLLCRLAERAEKSLNRSEFRFQAEGLGSRNRPPEGGTPNRSEFRFQAEGLDSRNHPPEGGTPNFSPANVLVDQWSLPLDGPSVSSQSLNALANERAVSQAGTDDRLTRHRAGESQHSRSSIAQRTIQAPKSVTNGDDSDWPLAAPASDEQGGRDET